MEPLLRRLLECEGSRLSLRSRVIGVEKSDEGFWLRVKRAGDDLETREGPFAAVFSTLPRFNSELLAPRETFAPRDDWATNAPDLWGASAAYVALTDDSSWPDEAFNVHSKLSAGPGPDGNDAYLSFSARGDETRAPNGLRVATLSTHVRLQGWDRENARDYSERKTALGSKLLEHVEAWSRTPRAKFHHTEFAAPPSFERYTGRRAGNVGGLPMTHENTIRSPRSQRTRLAGFYQIGDTSFPGQSVLACALGAVIATEKFLSDFG
jgi:phytoene dehydrogenase-like protein